MKNGKVYLGDCIRWSIARDGNRLYWVGFAVAMRIGCIGKRGFVSQRDMKLLNAWKRLWGAGD